MYNSFQLAIKYLRYYVGASNGKGHGVHSPFVFDFISQVLANNKHYYAYDSVEILRAKLKIDKTLIAIDDMGAGSAMAATNQRSIESITRHAAKPAKYGQLLFRIANHYRPSTIVELGTSLGISSAYLASGNLQANVVTMEGSVAIAEKALRNFSELKLTNIRLVQGNFDNTLGKVLEALGEVDMAFIDGNHRKAPTLDYFNQLLKVITDESVIVLDDIHWSSEMEEAWSLIKENSAVMLTIDLFFVGLVFFNPSFKVKQHFSIRY